MFIEENSQVIGHDGQRPTTLAQYRERVDATFKNPDLVMVGTASDGTPFDPETWGRLPTDVASQNTLMASLGVRTEDEVGG